MPTPTFRNLPSAKQHRFMATLTTEFARHEYHAASIDRIIHVAGISRGSFYQYFHDKRDAQAFAPGCSLQKRLAMTGILVGWGVAFARRLTGVVPGGRGFRFTYPLSRKILARSSGGDVLSGWFTTGDSSHEWVCEATWDGIATGELPPNIDPDAAVWLVESTAWGIGRCRTARLHIPDPTESGATGEETRGQTRPVVSAVPNMIPCSFTARRN